MIAIAQIAANAERANIFLISMPDNARSVSSRVPSFPNSRIFVFSVHGQVDLSNLTIFAVGSQKSYKLQLSGRSMSGDSSTNLDAWHPSTRGRIGGRDDVRRVPSSLRKTYCRPLA